MIVIVDHYDSFTNMLADYCRRCAQEVTIICSDEVDIAVIEHLQPTHLILSPGPGHPEEVSGFQQVIAAFYQRLPILGVCLGHQALWRFFGGVIVTAPTIMHGQISEIIHEAGGLFDQLPNPMQVTRYHSLLVDAQRLPKALKITATVKDDPMSVMAVAHRTLPIFGVQFHPEAALTQYGEQLLVNFFKI